MIRSDCETVVVFIQNSDESDQSMSRKLDSKRQNAKLCHGREKKLHRFDMACAKKTRESLRRLAQGSK